MDSLRRRVAERLAVATSPSSDGPRTVTSYSESTLRQYWMPDAVSVECYECSSRFTTFRRKHHCRVCGQIFCSKCCNIFISGKYLRCSGTLRVCAYCYKYFSQQHQGILEEEEMTAAGNPDQIPGSVGNYSEVSSISSSPGSSFLERSIPQRLSLLMGTPGTSQHHDFSSASISSTQIPIGVTTGRKKSSAMIRPNFLTRDDDLEENLEHGSLRRSVATNNQSENAELRPEINLKDPHMLEKLWEQIASPLNGIPLGTHRYMMKLYHGCFTGNDVIEWLQARDGTTWRSQAVALGQALLDGGYLEDMTFGSSSGSAININTYSLFDEKIPYRPILTHKHDDIDIGPNDVGASVTNNFDADGPEWLQQVDFPMEGNDYDMEGEWRPWVPKLSTSWAPEMPVFQGVRDKAREKVPSAVILDTDGPSVPFLDNLYNKHIQDYQNRLMCRERLSPKWSELIHTFCLKIVAQIKLEPIVDADLKRVNMDIRDFVKIKRISGGSMEDSSIVKGEVFSNRVIRVGMPLSLDNTNILLVKDSIAYVREDRYVSLANMKLQEEEYTKNICHKIKSFKPKLILVEKTVCRSAQDILCDAGIAVVLNVKSKVLKRVSRFFSTPIVESLGSIVEMPILGACDRYRSRMFNDISGGEPKNLISLEGRDLKNGCTIILRGGSGKELAKVKRIIRRLLLVKLHCKYERSFLLHQDVQTEAFPDVERVRFHEMTLSPFVNIPCDDNNLSDEIDDSTMQYDESPTEGSPIKSMSDQEVDKPPTCDFETFVFTKGFEDINTRNMLADYRAQSSKRARAVMPKPIPVPSHIPMPTYYKQMEEKFTPMLFGSHAPTTVNYCVPPWVVKMSFYHQNDIPLGVFLDSFCFDDTYKCPSKKECSIPMRDHIRRFCLGDACVTLILQAIGAPVVHSETNTIFMWKFCNECRNMSSILPLSYNSWMLSFSMFLLLCLNETDLQRRVTSDEQCPHSIHRDQFTCFAKGDLVALFKVSPIIYSSLVFPATELLMPSLSTASDRLLADFKDLSVKGSNLFSQINGKIVKLKAEGTFESFVSELLFEQEEDRADYRQRLDLIRDRIQLVEANDLLETQCAVVALNGSIYSSYTKWEAKLQQIQELKRKEEKSGKVENKVGRMSSGSMGNSTNSIPAGLIGTDKGNGSVSSDKGLSQSVSAVEDSLSAPSRIWHTMITSGPNESVLNSPFRPTVHPSLCLPGRAIIVDEGQPTSIIAFAMAKNEYQEFVSTRAKCESDSGSISESTSTGETSDRPEQRHFKCQFSDDHCRFYVCVHFALEFQKFRDRLLLHSENTIDFLTSLSECKQWASTGGKSGMAFYKTKDDRFIIKQMSGFEHNSFQDFAPHYFQYILGSQENGHRTLLAKIVGVYTVGYRNSSTGKSLKIDVLVIENLFYKRNIHESYDLKGSVRNRLATAGEKTEDQSSSMQVLMDENLLKVARERPFYIRKDKNPEFYSAIHRDTNFLTQHSMMDYSLLVGIDADTDDLVLGIIDYIRTFTWDKKLEMIIKSTGILGGRGKTPTIIYPKFYQKRFIEAMDTYFIQVPDYWYQFNVKENDNISHD